MKFKNVVIVLSLFLNIMLGLLLYMNSKKDGPVDVGFQFKEAVQVENYAKAKDLMAKERVEHISKETLKAVHEIMGSGTSLKTYQVLDFKNGEMVLLNLTPNDDYKIQDVIIVPKEFQSLFEY